MKNTMSKTISLPIAPYELAVLLKEVGFDVPVRAYYHHNIEKTLIQSEDDEIENYNDFPTWPHDWYSAPELALVAEWLREVHGLNISTDIYNGGWAYVITQMKPLEVLTDMPDEDYRWHDSHDTALQAAITHCLTKIKEQGK